MLRHPVTGTDQQYSDMVTSRDRITISVMGLKSELHKDALVRAYSYDYSDTAVLMYTKRAHGFAVKWMLPHRYNRVLLLGPCF